MKILHAILSGEFAGAEGYVASLARLQAQAGHEVRVVVPANAPVPRWQTELAVPDAKIAPALLVLPWWASYRITRWLAAWIIAQYTRGFEAEVLHSHLGRAHTVLARVAKGLGLRHIGTLHLRYKPKEHAACHGLIAIADWQLQEVPPHYRGKVQRVWNWLPRAPQAVEPLARAKDGIFCFGSVGRLHPQKGMTTLVKAFQQAFPTDQRVRLELVGEGPERPLLEDLCRNDSRVVLQGYQNTVETFYRRWNAYVSAARYEPFGLTILEAMSHGLPLVCTRTEGPREYLVTQPTQPWWAVPDEVGSLAAALQECRQANLARVDYDLVPFAPKCAAAQIEDFYKEILA